MCTGEKEIAVVKLSECEKLLLEHRHQQSNYEGQISALHLEITALMTTKEDVSILHLDLNLVRDASVIPK